MYTDNPILKNMTGEQQEQFKQKCINSDQYFYENYIKKLGGNQHLPDYSPEVFAEYKKEAERIQNLYKIKMRGPGPKPTYFMRLDAYYKFPHFKN
tara:strand:- start:34 stop:318 length:285 start_codon:yes stop_codon:yes gene_type:complete